MVDTSWRRQNPQASHWVFVMPHSLQALLLMQSVQDVTVPKGYLTYWQALRQLMKSKEAAVGVPKAGQHLDAHLGQPAGPVDFSS